MAESLAVQQSRRISQETDEHSSPDHNSLHITTTEDELHKSNPPEPSDEYSSDGESHHINTRQEPENMSAGAQKLRSWLNKTFRIEMSDGRVLLGVFLCTDRDRNIILGSCSEYLPPKGISDSGDDGQDPPEEPRVLGLVMVPGEHIVSIHLDELGVNCPSESDENEEDVM